MKLKKVVKTHEANKVLEPQKLSTLIKRLQTLQKKYGGNVDVAFTDELSDLGHCEVTLNLQWETSRLETEAEAKARVLEEAERARVAAEVARLELKYGDALKNIRARSMLLQMGVDKEAAELVAKEVA